MAYLPQAITRRGLIAGAAALAAAPTAQAANAAAGAAAPPFNTPNGLPWTKAAFETAMQASGRPVDLSDAQFSAIQARKPAAMKMIADYLTMRLGAPDPAVLAGFDAVPREYYHYYYHAHRSTCGDAYDNPAKPWAIGYGSALSDYLGQAYMTQVCRPGPNDVSLEIGTGSGF